VSFTFKPSGSPVLPYPAHIPPGTWALVSDRAFPYHVPQVVCPICHQPFILSPEVHSVAPDGTVTPSLVCLQYDFSKKPPIKCSFHEWVRLEGWSP
jgi:hypothetical protein